jgi:Tubulin like
MPKSPQLERLKNLFEQERLIKSASETPQIQTPALVILLGSTASVVALELMRQMLTLQSADRRKVGLVYIDTDEPSSSVIEFRQRHKGYFQEFPLRIAVPVGISNAQRILQEMGPVKNDPTEPHTFIRNKEPQYFANGAGGIRNNGHVAACFHHQSIYDTLERALTAIMRVDTRQSTEWKNEVQVHIVTFLGGGTGSGILADIAVMVRYLLANRQHEQHINLFCMLPESVKGLNPTDLDLRKSNATACLLELVAFSLAAGGVSGTDRYRKYMRTKEYYLTKDTIANEIFLIGQSSMDHPSAIPRIVGLDIFQRITDASGIGYKEHSQQLERRTLLGESDDRGLPTMFGTSCPLEVRFPTEETAMAFAKLSAAYLLPLLVALNSLHSVTIPDSDRRHWIQEWDAVAPIDANPSNPKGIRPTPLNFDEFEEADQTRLDYLWKNKVLRSEREIEQRIQEVLSTKEKEEMGHIPEWPRTYNQNDVTTSLLDLRIKHLLNLREEYTTALDNLRERIKPRVPARPVVLEAELTQSSGGWLSRLIKANHNHAYDVFVAYNDRLSIHAQATRYARLEQLLERLLNHTQEAIGAVQKWSQDIEMETHIRELKSEGLTSMAWQGLLDNPHPHQRHIFDLRTLRANDGRCFAVERIYLWATAGEKALNDGTAIDFGVFVDRCVDYLGRNLEEQDTSRQDRNSLEEQNAGHLADRVVDYFYDYYMEKFQNKNLFELLERAAPPSLKGESRIKQIGTFLYEHLENMRGLMRGLVAFKPELWPQGQSTLGISIYLGLHWYDDHQKSIFEEALNDSGLIVNRGAQVSIEKAIDPHRLQVSYGQHAFSLSTVVDFYRDHNSAMEAYLLHQEKWDSIGNFPQGFMPTHSSEEAQRLVREPKALGLRTSTPLYRRLIRRAK